MFQKHPLPLHPFSIRRLHSFPVKRKDTVDMTQGSITRHILNFALPMLLGNIFSLLYSTIDSWVLGNFGSNEAYAAVGSVGSIISILVQLAAGIAAGVSVFLGQKLGARQTDEIEKTVHTTCTAFFFLGILFTAIGLLSAPLCVDLINTPETVRGDALTYLNIYYLGMVANLLCQACSNIARASGDAKTPVWIGIIGTVLNTVLDLIFVICFKMGVAGVAVATIIAQYLSAVLHIINLCKSKNGMALRFSKLGIDWKILSSILNLGLPIALQASITSVSTAMIQTHVNHFGSDYISAWATYRKYQGFMNTPIAPITSVISIFVAQNLGAGKLDRIQKCVHITNLMCLVVTVAFGIPSIFFAPQLAAFFNSKPEVVSVAAVLLQTFTPLLFLNHVVNVYVGALRGMGNTRVPMFIVVGTFTVFRQICMLAASLISDNFYLLISSFPVTWILGAILIWLYYRKVWHAKLSMLQ